MPIYEFQCHSCGTIFDRLQKMSDPDPTECPTCKTPRIDRRVTAPSFRLAGSGWYETDFKKDSDKKRNIAGDGAGKSEGKPDAKPEGKPGTKPDTNTDTSSASSAPATSASSKASTSPAS